MSPLPGGRRLRIEWWAVALIASAVVLFLAWDRTATRLDNLIYDALLSARSRAADPAIVIVAIDNRSLAEAGRWPWPRATHARLVEQLAAAHPRAIGYDVLFVEPAPGDDDARLGAAFARAPSFLPLLIDRPGSNGAAFDAIEPVAPIRAGAAGIGQVNMRFDGDGIVRRIDMVAGDATRQWPQLTELMRNAAGRGVDVARGAPSTVMLSYAGPPGHFPTVSAASLMRGEVPPELLRDRLVLVGATAEGLGDQYPVPFGNHGGVMAGVEIHANLLDALLGDHIVRPVYGRALAAASLVPLWLLLFAFRRLSPRATALLLAVMLASILAASGALLALGLWLPPATAMIALAIVYPLWGWRRLAATSAYMTNELQAFSAEPDILPHAAADPGGSDLVEHQSLLLHDAIGRMRAMRRFVSDRLHQLPDATFVTDRNGHILLINGEGQRLLESLGVTGEGQRLARLLAQLSPEREGEGGPPALPPADTRETVARAVTTADGRSFDLRFAPQSDAGDALVGWIVMMIDTSAARASERQREQIMQLLTHDMRSPQSSIIALIEDAPAGALDPGTSRRIEAYARRTLSLADGFVQLARAEAVDHVFAEVDLDDIVVEAVDELWPQSSARGITVQFKGPGDELLIMGDRAMLARAFINLIGNAIKYSHDGGEVRVSLTRRGGEAVCAIADDGVGIAQDKIATLFEPFTRARHGEGPDGIGLGLALVKTVVTRHQGAVICESTPGKGATFTVTLPLLGE